LRSCSPFQYLSLGLSRPHRERIAALETLDGHDVFDRVTRIHRELGRIARIIPVGRTTRVTEQ
jgi:hypothetical protein